MSIVDDQADGLAPLQHELSPEEPYRNALRVTADAFFITTPDGRWLDCNQAAVDLFGYGSPEELQRTPIQKLYLDGADREAHLDAIRHQKFVEDYRVDLKRRMEASSMPSSRRSRWRMRMAAWWRSRERSGM